MMKIKFLKKQLYAKLLFLLAIIFSLTSCDPEGDETILFNEGDYQNILQYINENNGENPEEYGDFIQIIEAAKLKDVLSSYNSHGAGTEFTLLLPNNAAVQSFIEGNNLFNTLPDLLKDTNYVKALGRYHIINGNVKSYDFPDGVMPNKTLSDDFLTIKFNMIGVDSVSYSINNEATLVKANLDFSNGTVHIINKMLTPVVYSAYEWVNENAGYSIFAQLLEASNLSDTLNSFYLDELGKKIFNEYSLIVESDELYSANNINSFDDLVTFINPSDNNYSDPNNAVNKFARYHVLEGSAFLDELKTQTYNTFGDYPIDVKSDTTIRINSGVKYFDPENKPWVNYLNPILEKSNILTKTGAIHELDQILKPFRPGRKTLTFDFLEEPYIYNIRNDLGSTVIRQEDVFNIELIGIETFQYFKSDAAIPGGCADRNYYVFDDKFEINYNSPKILEGKYTLKVVASQNDSQNAMIQFYIDDEKVGNSIDLTTGRGDENSFNGTTTVGDVEFSNYQSHTIKIKTIVAGKLILDRIILEPLD